jgi:hypothetical protein
MLNTIFPHFPRCYSTGERAQLPLSPFTGRGRVRGRSRAKTLSRLAGIDQPPPARCFLVGDEAWVVAGGSAESAVDVAGDRDLSGAFFGKEVDATVSAGVGSA